jgi:hypothetical protein
MAEVIVEPLSAGTLKCSDSGGMMADDLDLSIEQQFGLVFQVGCFPELNAEDTICGNGVRHALTEAGN